MEIGIGLPNPIPGVRGDTVIEWARRADRRGFSNLATIDRVVYPSYESLVVLAAAAGATERIGVLTNVLLAPLRDPVLLAKQAASLDQLSAGRLTLGLAVGSREDDFEACDKTFSDRGEAFDRGLDLMHRAWLGEPVAAGREAVSPQPVKDGRVPILIGGMSDKAIERTVKWGIGWTAGGAAPDQVASFADKVRRAWKDSGREGEARIVALSYYALDEEEDDASAYIRDYYRYLGEWVDAIVQGILRTPDDVKARAKQFEDAGVDEFILDPTVAKVEQVDRLADVVL